MEKSKGTSFVVRIRTSRTAAFGLAGVMFASQLGYGFSIGFLKLPPLPRVPKTSAMVGVPTVKWEPSSEPVPWPTLATLVASVYPETLTVCDRTEAPQSLPGDNTPLQGSGAGGPMGLPNISPFGPTAGDPVNLTNGQEEYRPGADMYVYNPTGPSVVWKRSYNSMTNWDSALGMGWSHPYNIAVLPPNGGTPGQLVFANNARATFTCTVPTNGNSPKVATWSNNGVGIYLEWHYDAGGNYFVATFKDHSSMTTVKTSTDAYLRPAKWADKLGYHVKFTYGDYTPGTDYAVRPRLTSVTDSSNVALLTFTLDGNGNIQQAYDRYSRSVYYTVSSHAYGTGGVTPSYSYELDQASVVVPTGTGSPPARHTHTYANYNNAASQLVPYLATITVPDPDGSGTAVSTLTYDSLGRVADIEDANGYKSVFTYNSGNTQVDLEDGSSNLFYRYLVYYTGKLVTSVKDQNLDTVVSYHYGTNAPGKPDTVTREYKVSPHLARVTTLSYDTNGNLLTALLPSGLTTTYTYTTNGTWPLGRLDSVQVNNGGAALEPTTFVYNGSFQLVQVDTPVPGDSVGAGSQSSYITYTAMGNVDTVTTPGNNDTAVHTTTYGYTSDSWGSYSQSEAMGQPITVEDTLTHVTHLRYDSQGRVTNAADPLLNETVFTYNIAGQCDSATLPEAVVSAGHAVQTTSYLYPGGPVVQTDAYPPGSGSPMRTVNLAYGHEGELLSRTGDCEEVSYTYDPVYRVLTLSDGVPNTTTYTYDALGHLTDVDLPGATGGNFDQTHFTSFDLQGNCLSRTDGLGVVTDYTYGTSSADDGLLSLVNYPGTSQSVTLGRDVFDRVDSVTDFAGVETYDHDYLGNVTSKTTTYTTVTAQTFDYTFYLDGSRETMVNSAGTWTYYYDSDGRCRRMDSPADVGGVHFTSTYFDDDTQDRRTLPNGMYTDNTYDNLGLPASVLNKNGGGTVKSQFDTFTYDGVFNMTSVTTSNHTVAGFNGTTNYAYDSQDRLTSDSSPTKTNGGAGYSESFAYDGAGNPTTWKSASQTFNSDNQLTATGYAFDGNGNATTYAAATLAYDPEDRLKQFNVTGVSKFYKWRADGLKAWDSVVYSTNATISPANVGTYYYYDRGNAVLETSSGGTVNQVNVFAPDGLVARKESGAYKYYQFDQQGNAVTRSNSAGTVTSGACYDAYGLNFFSPQAGDTFRYNARWGYRLDADTGLTLCQHRYYDAGNGRWVNRDPIGYSGGANLYGYCESGPVGREDAAGLAHIYVCRTHIAGDHWHAVIVITDGKNPYKRAAVAEAFPNWDVAHGGRLLGNLSGGARDENSYLVGGGELRYEDDNSVDYWKKQLKRIIPDEVPYWLFPYEGCGGGNSNSWVRECLERMGLDPRYPKDGIFPGWEADPWDSIWHAK